MVVGQGRIVTFILGNGFDMALNLKTSYKDFYKFITAKESDNLILNEIRTSPENWADLEEQLGLYTFDNNFQYEKFYNDYIEILKELKIYLKKQENMFVEPKNLKPLYNLFNVIEQNLRSHSQKIPADFVMNIFNQVYRSNFITFNYTNTIDRLINKLQESDENYIEITSSVHIHGTLDSPMALGVNDKTQYNCEQCPENFQRYFEKYNYTKNNDLDDAYLRMENRILESDLLVCFGTSFGKTDKEYWKLVGKWLKSSMFHKILIFDFDTNFDEIDLVFPGILDQTLDKSKDSLIAQLGLTTEQEKEIRNQIHPLYQTTNLLEIITKNDKQTISKWETELVKINN